MREMKYSGVEWIGDIPKDWDVMPFKFSLKMHNGGIWGTNPNESEKDCICVRVADFDYSNLTIGFSDSMTIRGYKNSEIESSYIQNGDILLEKSGGGEQTPVGRSVIYEREEQAMCANFIECLRPNDNFNSKYLNYFLSTAYKYGNTKKDIKQTTGIQNLDINAFMHEMALYCDKAIQTKIADYLDKKCADIDKIITAKEKTIELLKERKQSVIYEAVTKGLDKSAPMKYSGLEWIGDIPKDWDMLKMTYLFETIGSGTTPNSSNPDYYDGEYYWLQTGDLNDNYITDTSKKITKEAIDEISSLQLYTKETIIIAMYGATIGKLGILTFDSYTNQACCAMAKPKDINSKYVFYWLLSNKENIVNLSFGGGQPNINQDIIRSLKVSIPKKFEEQSIIVDYLDKQSLEIDTLISDNEKLIEQLKEYRQSIIYEAVTGKIEI